MNDIYSIQEDTLTAIGDALRRKFGETKTIIVEDYLPIQIISKTPNAITPEIKNGGYPDSANDYDVVHIPGATRIVVDLYYETEGTTYDWVQVASGALDATTFPTGATKYGSSPTQYVQLTFEDTDSITFFFRTDGSGNRYLGYYAICMGYDADGNVILSDELAEIEQEVFNDYSPLEMPQAIDAVPDPVVMEPVVLTGDCDFLCSGPIATNYIKSFGDSISTQNINSGESMFANSSLNRIPFDINLTTASNSSAASVMSIFTSCKELEELPNITGSIRYPYCMCYNCEKIREIPESWATSIDWKTVNTYTSTSAGRIAQMFQNCYSLRRIPEAVLKNIYNNYTTSSWHGSIFSGCYTLDELVGFRGTTANVTSNTLSNFSNCNRLKRLVFDMDNGQPRVHNWKSQTIDLTYAGYGTISVREYDSRHYILDFNSGITEDKMVVDDATYLALKNDPDWFTCDINYSRYNRESAVETINSLPDVSSSGGTNTIKFSSAAGSKTDGGAINTMTAEEIAVATAKGWTVSFS